MMRIFILLFFIFKTGIALSAQLPVTVGTSGSKASLDTNFGNIHTNFTELYEKTDPIPIWPNAISAEELEALDNVSGNIQTQLSGKVGTTGDETIAGIKTFSSSPIVPTPTTDYQASTKKYVDDSMAAAGAGDITGVTAGTGLEGGGDTGAVTVSLSAANVAAIATNTAKISAPNCDGFDGYQSEWNNTTKEWDCVEIPTLPGVTITELGYVAGSTGNLQTQINGKQAANANLTTYAGITPSANVQSYLAAASYAAMRALLDLEAGTDFYSITAADAKFTEQIAAGTSALGTSEIASGACASAVTTTATGTATTDVVSWSFNSDPTSTTGYNPSGDLLYIVAYPSANNVNFKVCNKSGSAITPGAITLNWRVDR